jgi:hypothetical protein
MGKIFVAADTAGPDLWFGFNPFGHSQIVYENSEGILLEAEVLAPAYFGATGENWDFRSFGKPHNVPAEEEYGIYELDLTSGQSSGYVWELLQQVHESLKDSSVFEGAGIEYDTDPP